MNFYARKVLTSHLLKLNTVYSFCVNHQKAVDMHKAILATRIIKLIAMNTDDTMAFTQKFTKTKSSLTQTQNRLCQLQKLKQNKLLSKGTVQLKNTQLVLYPSLKAKIVHLINQYSKNQEVQTPQMEARQVLLSYFQKGVWIHQQYCKQQRFPIESNKLSKLQQLGEIVDKSVEENFKEENFKNEALYKKVTFCPTYLTTGQCFRKLLRFNKQFHYLLYTGHDGIGRTYSFILYRLLSEMIFRFKYLYCQTKKELPKQIDMSLPKMVYWDINMLREKRKQNIEMIIRNQCYELKKLEKIRQNYKYNLYSEKLSNEVLCKVYLKYFEIKNVIVLCDQIDLIVSGFRNYKNYFEAEQQYKQDIQYKKIRQEFIKDTTKYKKLQQKDNQIKEKLQIKFGSYKFIRQNFNIANDLNRIKQHVRHQFEGVLYLSSQNIQKKFLEDLNLNGQHKHTPVMVQNFEYRKHLNKSTICADTIQLISFHLKHYLFKINTQSNRLIKNNELTPQQNQLLTLIQKQLKKLVSESKILISPLAIFQAFREQKGIDTKFNIAKRQLLQDLNKQTLKENITTIFSEFEEKQKQKIITQINRFLNKQTNKDIIVDKKILFIRLYLGALARQLQKQQNPNISQFLKVQTDDLFISANQGQITNEIQYFLDKNIFHYHQKEGFTCLLDEKVIIQILKKKKNDLYKTLLESEQNIFSLLQRRRINGAFQSIIRQILSQRGTNLKMKNKKSGIEYLTFQNMNPFRKLQKHETLQTSYFATIPFKNLEEYQNYEFLKEFQSFLGNLKQGNYFILPLNKQKQFSKNKNQQKTLNRQKDKLKQVQSRQNYKYIDFVICKFQTQKIHITAFDVTISQSLYWNKIINFLTEFINFKDKNKRLITIKTKIQGTKGQYRTKQYEVQLKYVIICPNILKDIKIDWQDKLNNTISIFQKQLVELENEEKSSSKFQRLTNKIKNLNQINLVNKDNFNFEVKFKQSNQESLLKQVVIWPFFDIQFSNNNELKINSELRLFQFFQNNTEKCYY